ncbi:MAG: phosphoglucomutase/phosphomannomutase family protein, partial [Flavobacteriales bacterium]
MDIKFGTDGWRAIIAKEFTVENVARVTKGVCTYLKNHFDSPSVVIGYDCRFAGDLFAETAAKVFCENGIFVKMAMGYVSTPMVSLGTLKLKASIGVIVTASHNPSAYSGYKLKGHYGGPLLEEGIMEVESYIPDSTNFNFDSSSLEEWKERGFIEIVDLETLYCNQIERSFDLDAIRKSKMVFAYDAMYGSGQNVIKRLLPNVKRFRCEHNPHFYGISPEPIMRNLGPFSEYIKAEGDIDCALVNDGDADRIGMMDGKGNYIDSHHIMLLLINYLYKYKGYKGKIATGEESGGIAVQGHIPERDGIWNGMVIWEFMVKSGKTIEELIQEVYDLVGTFAFERIDLTLPQELKESIIAKCKAEEYHQFGEYKVERLENLDGYKYVLSESEWVMIRPSGTEP